jgi:hypothetical protein
MVLCTAKLDLVLRVSNHSHTFSDQRGGSQLRRRHNQSPESGVRSPESPDCMHAHTRNTVIVTAVTVTVTVTCVTRTGDPPNDQSWKFGIRRSQTIFWTGTPKKSQH